MTDLLNAGKEFEDASLSPEGTRDTAPLAADIAEANQALVEQWADKLFDASATDIMEWTAVHAPGRIAVTMSMENTVLAELAAKSRPGRGLVIRRYRLPLPGNLRNRRRCGKALSTTAFKAH